MEGEKIKMKIWEARTEKGINIENLSKMTGISESALYNYEIERRSPNLIQLSKIAKALNVRMCDLYVDPMDEMKK